MTNLLSVMVLNPGKDKSLAVKDANIVGPTTSATFQANQSKGKNLVAKDVNIIGPVTPVKVQAQQGQSPAAKAARLLGPTASTKDQAHQGSGKGKGKAIDHGNIIGPALPDRSHLPRVPIGHFKGISPMVLQDSSTPRISKPFAKPAISGPMLKEVVPVARRIEVITKDEIKVEENPPTTLPVTKSQVDRNPTDLAGAADAFTASSIDKAILAVLAFAASLKPKLPALRDIRIAEANHVTVKKTVEKTFIASPPSPMSDIQAPAVQPAINGALQCDAIGLGSPVPVVNENSHGPEVSSSNRNNTGAGDVPFFGGSKEKQKPANSELYKSKWAPRSLT